MNKRESHLIWEASIARPGQRIAPSATTDTDLFEVHWYAGDMYLVYAINERDAIRKVLEFQNTENPNWTDEYLGYDPDELKSLDYTMGEPMQEGEIRVNRYTKVGPDIFQN